MGLTERHWFENEDVPENYERALEDAVYNSRTNKKADMAKGGEVGMIQIDMQMPDSCGTCKFMDDTSTAWYGDYPFCRVSLQNIGYDFDVFTKRFPNCPLKPVEEQKEGR